MTDRRESEMTDSECVAYARGCLARLLGITLEQHVRDYLWSGYGYELATRVHARALRENAARG